MSASKQLAPLGYGSNSRRSRRSTCCCCPCWSCSSWRRNSARRALAEASLAALEGDAGRLERALAAGRRALPRGMDPGLNQLTADQLDAVRCWKAPLQGRKAAVPS
jgi:hypothetical protein